MSFKTIFIASALAASALVNAAVLPRQESSTGPSCENRAPQEKFRYTASSNKQFEVICGADYYGSDIGGVQWPGSFEGCLELCDANAECNAVSWNGACYLKGSVPGLDTSSNSAHVWTAKKNPSPTCDSNTSDGVVFPTSAGDFEIICGKDYGGNDLDAVDSVSFAECIETCAANQQCVDVSFVYGSCYLKKALGELSTNGAVWSAKRVGATTTTPTVPVPETTQSLTCENNKDDTKTHGAFTVQCGNDHWGADIGSVSGTSFEQCMDACSSNSECVVVSFVYGTCYMKNAVNAGQTGVGHVWGAVRTDLLTSTSSPADDIVDPTSTSTVVEIQGLRDSVDA